MDRRNFIKLFASAFVGSVVANPTNELIGNKVRSSDIFIEFIPPGGWVSADFSIFEGDERMTIHPDPDRELESPTPIFLYTRYQEPYKDMNPSVGIFADEVDEWMGLDIDAFHDEFVSDYLSIIPNGVQVPLSYNYELDNYWRISEIEFDFVGATSFFHRVHLRIFSAFHNDRLIVLFLTDSADKSEDASKEFSDFIKSIRLI